MISHSTEGQSQVLRLDFLTLERCLFSLNPWVIVFFENEKHERANQMVHRIGRTFFSSISRITVFISSFSFSREVALLVSHIIRSVWISSGGLPHPGVFFQVFCLIVTHSLLTFLMVLVLFFEKNFHVLHRRAFYHRPPSSRHLFG